MSLIITGCQRSGTTLLFDLCNSHPDITVTMEFGNFLNLDRPFTLYMFRMIKRWGGIGIRNWPLVSTSGNIWVHVNKRLNWKIISRNHAFIARYLLKMLKHQGKQIGVSVIEKTLKNILPGARIVGDKYPDYVFELDNLAKSDDLSILVIYRDCRDVASSALRLASTARSGRRFFIKEMGIAEKAATRWVKAVESMQRNKDRLYLIRYEDLVRDKERELKALAQWLGVDPAGFDAGIIKDGRSGKYKSGLSDEDLATIMEIAGSTMSQSGYV